MESFVFVSETGLGKSSLKSSSKKLVRAHVMRQHWQLVQNSKAVRKKPSSDEQDTDQPNQRRRRRTPSKSSSSNVSFAHASKKPVGRQTSIEGGQMSTKTPTSKMHTHSYKPQISSTLPEGRIAMDSDSLKFFDHFAEEFTIVLCDPAQPVQPRNSDIFPYMAVQNNFPALAHAMCYMGAIHEALIHVNKVVRPRLIQTPPASNPVAAGYVMHALYHKTKCLDFLRLAFKQSNASDNMEPILLCIALLIASETSYGDQAHTLLHCKGLGQVIDHFCGGTKFLPEHLIVHVYLAELKAATSQLRPHLFPLPQHLAQQFEAYSSLSMKDTVDQSGRRLVGTASGFFNDSHTTPAHPTLVRCILYALHLFNSQFFPYDSQRSGHAVSDYIPLNYMLLSLFSEEHDKHDSLTKIDQCIQTGLLLFSNTIFWKPPLFFKWVVNVRIRLCELIKSLDWTETKQRHPKLMLWMIMMGVHSSNPEPNDEKDWWEGRLREVSGHLKLKNPREAREAVEGFFYNEDVYGWVWQLIWNEQDLKKWAWYPCVRVPDVEARTAAEPIE